MLRRQLLLSLCTLPAWASATKHLVIHPRPESATDERSQYALQLLALALGKSAQAFQLQASPLKMQQQRALTQLAAGLDVDVVWSMTSRERERDLLPIRIPIDKGLLGWRIFLVHQDHLARFAQIQTQTQLQNLLAGQGHDWPDTQILRAAGLKVHGDPNYERLFMLLSKKEVDYFPRSILEIQDELKNHPHMQLTVEPELILFYPTAMYFFVNKKNTDLANAIETGLQKAIADGSFEQLFQNFHGDMIQRANLKGRRKISLDNPFLPKETPLNNPKFWLTPQN